MNEKNAINSLGGNTSLVISILGFVIIGFTSITLFNGLKFENVPNYLKYSSYISIIFFTVGLIQSVRFNIKRSQLFMKYYAQFLTTINILVLINIVIAFDNIYYFAAIQNGIDLYPFWRFNIVTTLISFALYVLSGILYLSECKILLNFITPKTRTYIGFICMILSYFIYVVRIYLFIKIPNIADNAFLILISIFIIIGFQIAILALIWEYRRFIIAEGL
ncbi:DUF5079 family protein [Staphylococcus agnetis]|uniref:DUF5079 family protein n=1 Tax=Staphylococcus agnetis TaxID=985762 RepID=UPI000D19A656|nr:DUF5079 family protein [Staphylococcus agnetis]PTH37721.1 hypothetical protein BU588_11910 [Staphylococcus agnetis]